MKQCKVKGCRRKAETKGWCKTHYMRWWHTGDVKENIAIQKRIIGDDEARFLSKVEKTDNCWNWTGAKTKGYGVMRMKDQRNILAHRFSYEMFIGLIPEGLQIDHLCRNHSCVNPTHLEIVTNKENCLRGESLNAQNARKTHCIHGHEFTPENTYLRPDTNNRQCLICKRIYRAEYKIRTGK